MDTNIILGLLTLAVIFAFGTWFCIKVANSRKKVQDEAEKSLELIEPECEKLKATLIDKKETEILISYRTQLKKTEYYLKFITENNEELNFTVDQITYEALEVNTQGTLLLYNDDYYDFKY